MHKFILKIPYFGYNGMGCPGLGGMVNAPGLPRPLGLAEKNVEPFLAASGAKAPLEPGGGCA